MTVSSLELPPDAVLPPRHPEAPAPGTELPSHYVRCFGCGEGVPHGLRVQGTAGEGLTVSATFEVTEHHQGAPGIAHGGLLTAALDEALGLLGHLVRSPLVTARLETDFRRPVPVGARLHLRCRIDGAAGRKLYMSAEGSLNEPDGPVAVTARALFVKVPLQHYLTHGRPEDIRRVAEDPEELGKVRHLIESTYQGNP